MEAGSRGRRRSPMGCRGRRVVAGGVGWLRAHTWASIGRRVLVQVVVACGWHAHSARASDGAIANVGLSMVVRLCTICVVVG